MISRDAISCDYEGVTWRQTNNHTRLYWLTSLEFLFSFLERIQKKFKLSISYCHVLQSHVSSAINPKNPWKFIISKFLPVSDVLRWFTTIYESVVDFRERDRKKTFWSTSGLSNIFSVPGFQYLIHISFKEIFLRVSFWSIIQWFLLVISDHFKNLLKFRWIKNSSKFFSSRI